MVSRKKNTMVDESLGKDVCTGTEVVIRENKMWTVGNTQEAYFETKGHMHNTMCERKVQIDKIADCVKSSIHQLETIPADPSAVRPSALSQFPSGIYRLYVRMQ